MVAALPVRISLVSKNTEPGSRERDTDGMIYTRGAGSDYDKWAEMTGDNGWRWDSLMPLIKRVRFRNSHHP